MRFFETPLKKKQKQEQKKIQTNKQNKYEDNTQPGQTPFNCLNQKLKDHTLLQN